jgi:hypothetical protein
VEGNKGKVMDKMKLKTTKEKRRKGNNRRGGDVTNMQDKDKMRRKLKEVGRRKMRNKLQVQKEVRKQYPFSLTSYLFISDGLGPNEVNSLPCI